MKKRFKKWLLYFYIKYIPSTTEIAPLEAKRLSKFLCERYDEHQQLIILEEMKANIIEYRKQQIEQQKLNIIEEQKYLVKLENNHLKLIA